MGFFLGGGGGVRLKILKLASPGNVMNVAEMQRETLVYTVIGVRTTSDFEGRGGRWPSCAEKNTQCPKS